MRAGGALQLLHLLHSDDDAMAGRAATGSKHAAFAAARAPPAAGFPLAPPVKRPAWRSASREEGGHREEDTAGPSNYMGAEAAALLACVTATLLVLPLLLPPLPPPPPLFLLVPVAIFAVLLLLVLVPSDARGNAAAVGVGLSSSSSSPSSSPYL